MGLGVRWAAWRVELETTLFIAWGTFGFVIKCAGTMDLIGGTAVILLHTTRTRRPQGNVTRAVPAIGVRGCVLRERSQSAGISLKIKGEKALCHGHVSSSSQRAWHSRERSDETFMIYWVVIRVQSFPVLYRYCRIASDDRA